MWLAAGCGSDWRFPVRQSVKFYAQNADTLSGEQPLLPRSLDVPHDVAGMKSTPAAKRNSISVPERNDEQLEQHPDAEAMFSSSNGSSVGTAKGQTVTDVRLPATVSGRHGGSTTVVSFTVNRKKKKYVTIAEPQPKPSQALNYGHS